jgi:uncharacterized membrane protein (DUF485 family)
MTPDPISTLEVVSAARWRVALSLTAAMMAAYFGFILLVAFNKPLLGILIAPGLSLGMLLGALVIVIAWALTWIYVRWANTHYDSSLDRLRK